MTVFTIVIEPDKDRTRLRDDGSHHRSAPQNPVNRRGGPDLPENILGMSTVDQDDASMRRWRPYSECRCHLEYPESIGVALAVESKIPRRYAVSSRRGLVDTGG